MQLETLLSGRWRTLTLEQQTAWRIAAANKEFATEKGRWVRLHGYNLFVGLNLRRAELGLPQFDFPPAEPIFSPNPVAELVITNIGGKVTLKLRVPAPGELRRFLVATPLPHRTLTVVPPYGQRRYYGECPVMFW
jgi:hypothetical protein